MIEPVGRGSLEKLESLKGRISGEKIRKRLGDQLDVAILSVAAAEPSLSRLKALSEYIYLVRDHLDKESREELRRLLQSVRKVSKQIVDATDAEKLREVAASVKNRLVSDINQIDQIVKRGWKGQVDRAFWSVGLLGSVLGRIPETMTQGQEMQSLHRVAQQLASSVEDASRSRTAYFDLIASRDQINEKLSSIGGGEAVVQFLLAVAEQSATLEHVTEDVRAWLNERHALEQFKVGL